MAHVGPSGRWFVGSPGHPCRRHDQAGLAVGRAAKLRNVTLQAPVVQDAGSVPAIHVIITLLDGVFAAAQGSNGLLFKIGLGPMIGLHPFVVDGQPAMSDCMLYLESGQCRMEGCRWQALDVAAVLVADCVQRGRPCGVQLRWLPSVGGQRGLGDQLANRSEYPVHDGDQHDQDQTETGIQRHPKSVRGGNQEEEGDRPVWVGRAKRPRLELGSADGRWCLVCGRGG